MFQGSESLMVVTSLVIAMRGNHLTVHPHGRNLTAIWETLHEHFWPSVLGNFRMSGSRWAITSSWLPGSLRSFLYSISVYYCHLFLISSVSFRSIPFLSFIVPIFAWNDPLISLIFLKRSLAFPIVLFSSISLQWSPRKSFLSLLAIL